MLIKFDKCSFWDEPLAVMWEIWLKVTHDLINSFLFGLAVSVFANKCFSFSLIGYFGTEMLLIHRNDEVRSCLWANGEAKQPSQITFSSFGLILCDLHLQTENWNAKFGRSWMQFFVFSFASLILFKGLLRERHNNIGQNSEIKCFNWVVLNFGSFP